MKLRLQHRWHARTRTKLSRRPPAFVSCSRFRFHYTLLRPAQLFFSFFPKVLRPPFLPVVGQELFHPPQHPLPLFLMAVQSASLSKPHCLRVAALAVAFTVLRCAAWPIHSLPRLFQSHHSEFNRRCKMQMSGGTLVKTNASCNQLTVRLAHVHTWQRCSGPGNRNHLPAAKRGSVFAC